MRRGLVLAALCFLAVLPGEAQPTSAAAQPSVLLRLMASVPDTASTRTAVYFNDYSRARAAAGVQQPPQNASADQMRSYMGALLRAAMSGDPVLGEVDDALWRRYAGFGLADLDGSISAGLPPTTYGVVTGRIDPAAVDRATGSTGWQRRKSHGVPTFAAGQNGKIDINAPPGPLDLSPVKRSIRFAVRDRHVLWTSTDEAIGQMISADLGRTHSLARVSSLRAVGSELDRLGAYTGVLSTQRVLLSRVLVESVFTGSIAKAKKFMAKYGAHFLLPYAALGLGWGRDARSGYLAVALACGTPALARAEARLLRTMVTKGYSFMRKQRWSAVFTNADVRVDGTTVLARLRTKDVLNPQSFFVQPDTLIASVA